MNSTSSPLLRIPGIGEPHLSDYQSGMEWLKRSGQSVAIDKINWAEYPYAPTVKLFAGYSEGCLWLGYEVKGDFFRAQALHDQEAVWEDCCVEVFISTEEEKQEEASSPDRIIYRNFEFNLLGFAYSAVGTKEHRELLGPTLMDQILRYPEFSREKLPAEGSLCDWGLCVAIPLKLLGIQKGSRFKGNFQKCGDLTRAPHFLSWNSILSDEPDFHLPQFFGEMELVH